MTIEIQQSDLQQLDRLLAKYPRTFRLGQHVEELGKGRPPGFVGALLWTAYKQGRPLMNEANYLLWLLPGAPSLWSADDLIALIRDVERRFPQAVCNEGSSGWWSADGGLPGCTWGLQRLVEEKKGDPDFARVMATRWTSLPDPWRLAVGYLLAAHGHVSHEVIGDADRRTLARLHLAWGKAGSWASRVAFPPEVWGPLLVAAAREDPSIVFDDAATVLRDLAPHVPLAELIGLVTRSRHDYHVLTIVKVVDTFGEGTREALEALLPTLEVPPHPDSDGVAWPHAVLALGYLRRCKREGRAPSPAVDGYLAKVLDRFRLTWGGGYVEEYHEMWWDALRVLPVERLEPMVRGGGAWRWSWVGACPTPAVLEEVVRRVVALPAKPTDYADQKLVDDLVGRQYNTDFRRGLLHPIRVELVPYVTRALAARTPAPQRHILVSLLARSGVPEAAPGLALALGDGSAAVRQIAREGLTALGAKDGQAGFEAALASRKKVARVTAAEVMAELEPGAAALHALAQARLAVEKDEEVRAALARVRAPGAAKAHGSP